jgi:hypothetical protein
MLPQNLQHKTRVATAQRRGEPELFYKGKIIYAKNIKVFETERMDADFNQHRFYYFSGISGPEDTRLYVGNHNAGADTRQHSRPNLAHRQLHVIMCHGKPDKFDNSGIFRFACGGCPFQKIALNGIRAGGIVLNGRNQ